MLTFGTIFAIVILALCALALVGGLISFFIEDGWVVGAFLVPGALVLAFITQIGFMMVGYNSDYMAYKPVSGKVEQIASRQIADGKGMSERFVFKINGQQYGVDDTRAALVKVGDTVNLNCTKQFVFGSTNNGYACNWG
jgi:hypothetical protein